MRIGFFLLRAKNFIDSFYLFFCHICFHSVFPFSFFPSLLFFFFFFLSLSSYRVTWPFGEKKYFRREIFRARPSPPLPSPPLTVTVTVTVADDSCFFGWRKLFPLSARLHPLAPANSLYFASAAGEGTSSLTKERDEEMT